MATQIGFVKAMIGEVTATAADGSIRTLQLGDMVYANELISTGPGGAVEIEFADGSVMDLGRNSQAMLDSEVFDPNAAAVAETASDDVPDDVAAIQQALLEGEDPTEIGEATAAGAGVEDGNEGHEAVFVDYLNPEVTPDAGFDTIGVSNEFDQPEEDIIILPEEEEETVPLPEVSVSVDVEIDIDDPPQTPPPEDGIPTPEHPVIVSGNAASILEGTGEGTRTVTFIIKLSSPFAQDVEVTYELRPVSENGAADTPDDWFDGPSPQTVTIPAGSTTFPVEVQIVEDHFDEANGVFEIVLLSATNATINPDADSAMVTIFDDDTTPVAQDDLNTVAEDEDDGTPVTEGNVISGVNDAGNDPAAQQDTDEDGDVLIVTNVMDADEDLAVTAGTTSMDGTVITGLYGTLTIGADGSYIYNLTSNDDPVIQGLAEGETLSDVFSYVVTDTFNQPQTATLTITITGTNDAPSLVVTNGDTGTVYEAGLADGSMIGLTNTTVSGDFTVADPDGLDDITHVMIGSTEIAIADLGNNNEINTGHSTLVITSYNALTGVATFVYTLTGNVDDVAGDEQDVFNLSVSDDGGVTYSATDDITITIIDDEPAFTIVNDGADVDNIVSLSALNPASDTVYEGQFADWLFGADGFDSVNLTLPDNVELASSSDTQIVLNLLEGDTVVAVLTLNADGTDSLEVLNREGDIEFIPVAATSAQAGGPEGSLLVDLEDSADFNIIVSGSDGDGNPNEFTAPNDDDLVNTSNNGWAVKGQQGQTNQLNESILFSFVSDVDNSTGTGIGDFKFLTEGYTGGISEATVKVRVYLDDSLTTFDEVTIDLTSGQVVQVSTLDWSAVAGNGSYSVGDDIFGVEIISAEPDGSYRVNGIEVGAESEIPPADLAYENIGVEIVDGDGDSASQTFSVYIDGDTGDQLTVETIAGTSGDDNLVGGSGNDFLIGGRGDDILTGGDGADIFDFNETDLGTADSPYQDEITDFSEVDGDVIDLADVLSNPDNQIAGVEHDGHLQIQVSNSEGLVQTIDVTTVVVVDDTAAQTALNSLLGSGAVEDGM